MKGIKKNLKELHYPKMNTVAKVTVIVLSVSIILASLIAAETATIQKICSLILSQKKKSPL